MKEMSLQIIISHQVPSWRDEGKHLVYRDKIPELQSLIANGTGLQAERTRSTRREISD